MSLVAFEQVLRQMNVEYVVAPYEADAQLAFFGLHGHVDLVITEDSDLIAYGCPKV
jgi:exonuclease-1